MEGITKTTTMNTAKAARVLREYNEWRREDEQPRELPYTAKEIGTAIDVAVSKLKQCVPIADIEDIVESVISETGVTHDELCGPVRRRKFSEARAIVSWLARNYTKMPMTAIGRRINRHHASIVNYMHLVNEWIKRPQLNEDVVKIIRKIQNEIEQV